MPPDLILHNADVWTMDPARPRASALAVRGGHILAVGDERSVREAAGPQWEDIDCGGDTVLPASIDAHMHLLSFAASLSAVDCSPAAVHTIPELLHAIGDRARRTPSGGWIRATGYRETELAERRHPTRWELDTVAPHNPVRLIHGSGHGAVLNSAALAAAGITNETEEPTGAFIGRRVEDGEIDGLLLEMNDLLDERIPSALWEEVRQGVAEASRRLLAVGITAVQDLGVRNDQETLRTFARLHQEGALIVNVMPALGIAAFLRRGEASPWTGLVKIVVNELDGTPRPGVDELTELLRPIDAAGAQACVHAVSAEACSVAAEAFERVLGGRRGVDHRHRIEHAAVCPPEVAKRIARLGLIVVTNPGFLHADGDRYLREIPTDDQPFLHNPGALRQAGVRVAFGSDAPVSTPHPLRAVEAAVWRRSRSGHELPGPLLALDLGLAAQTAEAAFAARLERQRGRLLPGMVADLVLLPAGLVPRDGRVAQQPDRGLYSTAEPRVMQAGCWVV